MKQNTLAVHINTIDQVDAIKANDTTILKALYKDNYFKIEKYVLNNNGSEDEAKDIFQEAFIAVWRNIQLNKFRPENETALAGYLFQVSKNKWLDYLRSSHYKKVVPMDNADVAMHTVEASDEEANDYITAVKSNFQNLGENCQDVLTRFYYNKQSLKEIARIYDWTEATARNNKYRCIQRLRELIKK